VIGDAGGEAGQNDRNQIDRNPQGRT
jgi:hypothetical protein